MTRITRSLSIVSISSPAGVVRMVVWDTMRLVGIMFAIVLAHRFCHRAPA